MTPVLDFLASRRPPPPSDLSAALRLGESRGSLDEALTAAGLVRLEEAEAALGRVRESAFKLLEADALLTYACEAALESEDPEAALEQILVAAGS